MEFLSTLPNDVKLLLAGGALALLGALMSGTKKNEHRYLAVFAVLLFVGAYRYAQEMRNAVPEESARVNFTPARVTPPLVAPTHR